MDCWHSPLNCPDLFALLVTSCVNAFNALSVYSHTWFLTQRCKKKRENWLCSTFSVNNWRYVVIIVLFWCDGPSKQAASNKSNIYKHLTYSLPLTSTVCRSERSQKKPPRQVSFPWFPVSTSCFTLKGNLLLSFYVHYSALSSHVRSSLHKR